jgi:aromatic-L-amino-acid/L-tryptophan decarboxylase
MTPYTTTLDTTYREEPSPFAMDGETFRQLGHLLVELASGYLEELAASPVYRPMPEEERTHLRTLPLPRLGTDPAEILAFFQQHILPWQRQQKHPRFSAFVDPGATRLSMFAMFMAAVMNNSGSGGDYELVYVEETAVRWLAELVGFPTGGSDGVLLGGGSDANRHGLEVARLWAAGQQGWNAREDGLVGHPRLVVYGTAQRHSCIDKAAYTLGLGAPHTVGTDQAFRMDLSSLREAVRADRAAGSLPFCVVASAGTVTTGAVDPLDALADFCEREGLWLHVDGAFGGLGAADPRLGDLYGGIGRAHSLALDPHKWLNTAIGCSCLLIRQGDLLQATYKLVPSYLRFANGKGFAGDRWYSHRSAEQTRPTNRALMTLWNIQQAGREGIVAHIRRHIVLADYLRSRIEATPGLEIVAGGPLPVVCFRAVPQELRGDEQRLNRFNQEVVERLQTEGVAFLGGVDVMVADHPRDEGGETYALRYCNLHHALTGDDVEAILAEVVRVVGLCLPAFALVHG